MTDRHALAMECLQVERSGGSVREFLSGKGLVSPWGTWFRLQKEELHRSGSAITDGKGKKNMGRFKDRKAMLEAIVAEIEAERDPIRMLDERGYTAASGSYTEAKCWAKKHAPELFEKLPQNIRHWKFQHGLTGRNMGVKDTAPAAEPEAADQDPEDAAAEPAAEDPADDPLEDLGLTDELPFTDPEEEPEPVKPAITRPVNYMGYDVTAIRSQEFGEFYYDHKFHCIDWRTEGGDEISLSPQGWKNLIEELPHILRVLGVDV